MINNNWNIVKGSKTEIVEETAAKDLQRFLQEKFSLQLPIIVETASQANNPFNILIGTAQSSQAIKHLSETGKIRINSHSSGKEGFHLKTLGPAICAAGYDAVGAMYAVFHLEDILTEREETAVDNIDLAQKPFFKNRFASMWGLAQSYPPDHCWEKYASWLAHHYFNGIFSDDIYGNRMPSSAATKYGLSLMTINMCGRYVFSQEDIKKWQTECPEAVQKAKWEWYWDGSDPNISYDKAPFFTLCPKTGFGKEKYKKWLEKLLHEEPATTKLMAYVGDGVTLCDDQCPRCGQDPYWKRAIDFFATLSTLGKEIKDDFQVVGHSWYQSEEAVKNMVENAAAGVSIMIKEPNGIVLDEPKGWVHYTDAWSDTNLMSKELSPKFGDIYLQAAGKRGEDFWTEIAIGDSCESIDPVIGAQLPWIVSYKIKRIADKNVKNFLVWWGVHYWVYSVNYEVLKKLVFNPYLDIDRLIEKIAKQDFGTKAQPQVIETWKKIDEAMTHWKYVNWMQKLEEFTARSEGLYFEPIFPETIKKNRWCTIYMQENAPLLIESYSKLCEKLKEAVLLAQEVYQTVAREDCRTRAKQQLAWLGLLKCIFTTQLNILRAITLTENTETNTSDTNLKAAFRPIIKGEITNLEETEKFLDLIEASNFRITDDAPQLNEKEAVKQRLQHKKTEMIHRLSAHSEKPEEE